MNTTMVDFEKRNDMISFRLPDSLRSWLSLWAESNNLKTSAAVLYICEQFRRSQRNQCPRQNSLKYLADRLKSEIDRAVADGSIDATERASITKPATAILNFVWNPKRTA